MPRVWNMTQPNLMQIDQTRTQNRLRQMQAEQAQSEMQRQNRLREAVGNVFSPSQETRNAALEAGGGPTQAAAGMMGGMNEDAIRKVMQLDPQTGMKIMEYRNSLGEQDRAQEDREAVFMANLFDAVERSDNPQEAYRRGLEFAAQRGIDVTDAPPEYSPQVANSARAWAASTGEYEPAETGGAPKTVGGMQWNSETQQYEPIPGYVDQKRSIAEAGRDQTTFNMPGQEEEFAKEVGKKAADRWNAVIEGGDRAAQSEIMVDRMMQVLSQDQVNTGILQPALTGLQAIGQDLGFDLDKQAESLGIRLGDLSNKEEFERLSKTLTMQALQGFKGQTSNKELDFARDQVARLGKSEGGNIRALAAMKAMNQIARENAEKATGISSQSEWAQFERNRLNRSADRVRELTDEYEEQLEQQVQDQPSIDMSDQSVAQPDQGGDQTEQGLRAKDFPVNTEVEDTEGNRYVVEEQDGRKIFVPKE